MRRSNPIVRSPGSQSSRLFPRSEKGRQPQTQRHDARDRPLGALLSRLIGKVVVEWTRTTLR